MKSAHQEVNQFLPYSTTLKTKPHEEKYFKHDDELYAHIVCAPVGS